MSKNTLLMAGFVTTVMAGLTAMPANAQINMGTFARDPAAPLANAMTEQQARAACRREMRGARESRASINRKMQICMNQKINGR